MKIYTREEFLALEWQTMPGSALEEDNRGQQIIYTGLYRWLDGTYRDERDPHLQEIVKL